jgi:hypothetical protein
VNINWMRQKLEAFLALCEDYEAATDAIGNYHKPTMKPIDNMIADALPTVEEIIRQLDPKLLTDEFGIALHIGGLSGTIRPTRKAIAILRDREELRINLAPDPPSLSADQLHPTIWRAAAPMWEAGQYKHAAQDASISLSDHIKKKAGSHLNEGELVAQVFKPDPPAQSQYRLYFAGNRADKNWLSRQRGLHFIAQGAFAGIRNIAVHDPTPWTEQQGLEHLAVLSIVARWADETQLVPV